MPPRKRQPEAEPAPEAAPAPSPWAELEALLDYRFRQPHLLELALTHRSFPYEGGQTATTISVQNAIQQTHGWRDPRNLPGTDNEQLEFLGDAVLGFTVTEALFTEFPQCGEGELTRLRSSLVSRKRMAEMGEQLSLGKHLLLGRSAELNGIRHKPTVIANAAEAVIAAVYLDARAATGSPAAPGDGFAPIRRLLERYLLGPERENLRREVQASGDGRAMRDHKTLLQERVQATSAGRLRYVDVGESGPAHQKRFTVEAQLESDEGLRILASAEGSSKKEAQQRAAALALDVLGPPEPEARSLA